ncbi:sodium ion-translocating decarboxylase subunit beta [Arcobacter roscoffensis]|uniref:Sodium ion-translocating decarboxylase subunit beta n=1 Tax=Arcobacter roscoffensis TaxID=2961520 RepID=A0ABY5E153_9BACT|nr:sodium ion-translocating decarboxylase subunit beta [Arcobacter roscoffensis]UTJ05172.1 sodium ion-translocating decarboxylase subunit beta [Arcobacter roscoffensis]
MKKSLFILLFTILSVFSTNALAATAPVESAVEKQEYHSKSMSDLIQSFYNTTGLKAIIDPQPGLKGPHGEELTKFAQSFGRVIMIIICLILFYLAIKKGFEPLLLIPIGFGGILANIPIAEIAGADGMLGIIYDMGISNGFFPLLIFMGVGAMTDFGPLLSNPKTALLGGAAQFGIFGSLVAAIVLSQLVPGIEFSLEQAAAISIIGGADGPTSIFIATALAPELLGAIAVAAYSYMALVPVIQPPIMRALTTLEERKIRMKSVRRVSKTEKIIFPIVVVVLTLLILPDAAPLIGAFCFGNFCKESGVVDRLSDTMQNSLINVVTIFLGLGVGSKLAAEQFLVGETLGIMAIGLLAFAAGTAMGVLMAKVMNLFMPKDNKINPLIGAAGVSAVPMAARVVSKEGQKYDSSNVLLMNAMGPNVAGVIGSAVAAGILISIFK